MAAQIGFYKAAHGDDWQQVVDDAAGTTELSSPQPDLACYGDLIEIEGLAEGAGITSDVMVTWTLDDFRAGRDPDLDAAVALLQGLVSVP